MDWEKIDANNEEDATMWAYEEALLDYQTYEGLHGVMSISDFIEEDGLTEEEAEDAYHEEVENRINYEAKWFDGDPNE
jgi:hypothetical protein